MRPVNLIPPEDRRGDKTPLRTGPFAYVVVALLAVAVIGMTVVVLTNNQISDRTAEKATLEDQAAQAQAEAKELDSFVSFAALQQAREDTVTSLATSRFDWERVLRELAIVIPSDVWLTNLEAKASASAASSSSSTSSSSSSEGIEGPSLDISGCAAGHEAVAEFLAAVREVDGVTRATVMSSDRQGASGGIGSTASTESSSSGAGCGSKSFVAAFHVIVAFDAAVPGAPTQGATSTPMPSVTATTPTASSSESTPSATGSHGQQRDSSGETAQRNDGGTFVAGTESTP